MTAGHDEVERKYDVDEAFELPSVPELLAGFDAAPAAQDGGVDQHVLEATYFDTADHRLFARRAHPADGVPAAPTRAGT